MSAEKFAKIFLPVKGRNICIGGEYRMDDCNYRTNRRSCYLLEYHLVLVSKYRRPVIRGRVKERLLEISYDILEDKWGCSISAINTDKDHIHVMFEASPQTQLSKLINNYKTVSSRILRKEFPEILNRYYRKPYFWSDSYFICTVSDRSHQMVLNYIRNQGMAPLTPPKRKPQF